MFSVGQDVKVGKTTGQVMGLKVDGYLVLLDGEVKFVRTNDVKSV